MDLQDIKAKLEQNRKKVDDASYWGWDRKCKLLSEYNECLCAVELLEKYSKLFSDDEYVEQRIESLKKQDI